MVESCTVFNLLMQLSLSSGDMETLPFMNSTFPKRVLNFGVMAHVYAHSLKTKCCYFAIFKYPSVPPKGDEDMKNS